MTLLREIQEAATALNPNPTIILRRCLVLAARLQHQPLREWVEQELNGYKSVKCLPDYRIVETQSYGNFRDHWGAGLNNVPISTNRLPEEVQDMSGHIYLMEGIEVYVDMIARSSEVSLHYAWPADIIHYVASKLDLVTGNARLQEAWRVLDMSTVAHLNASVVTRALDFSLAIERENPHAGEALPGESPPVPLERVNHVFNQTIIVNGQHNISIAGEDFAQNIANEVQPGDLTILVRAVERLGVDSEDLDRLRDDIKDDEEAGSTGTGDRVTNWLGQLTTKAAGQAATEAGAAGATALLKHLPNIAQSISNFYG